MSKPALLALLACLAAPIAEATVVKDETFETMTAHAHAVVRGTVRSVQPMLTEDHHIWTYVELDVAEVVKGDVKRVVLLKQPGGTIGEVNHWVAGAAKFAVGQDCVVFLERAVDEAGVHVVYAMAAGKVDLEPTGGEPAAVRHLDGLGFAAPNGAARVVRPVGPSEKLGPASAFLDRLRRAVKGGGR